MEGFKITISGADLCLIIFTHRLARTLTRLMPGEIRVLCLIQGEDNRFKTNVG